MSNPQYPTRLPCGSRVLDLARPHVMGILNVTPDSFSDGGRYDRLDDALRHAERMVLE
ncbi:dihydropteroate synthase, partial [Pseudomonas aeruginosa]